MVHPHIEDVSKFVLPVSSIYHFVDLDSSELSPTDELPYLKPVNGKTVVVNITDIINPIGRVRKVAKDLLSILTKLRLKNKKFKYVTDGYDINKEPVSNPVVFNYGLTSVLYTYRNDPLHDYTYWYNQMSVVIDKCKELVTRNDRKHYIPVELPAKVVTRSILKKHVKEVTRKTILDLEDIHNFSVRDLWLWIDETTRDKSIFSKIDSEHLDKIILVFIRNGKFTLLNLGTLYGFIKGKEHKGLSSKQVQNLFLSMLYNIGGDVSDTPNEEDITRTEGTPEDEVKSDVPVDTDTAIQEAENDIKLVESKSNVVDSITVVEEVDDPTKLIEETDNTDKLIEEQISLLTKQGVLTPRDVNKVEKLLTKQQSLESPYDPKVDLSTYSKVTEKDIQLTEEDITMPDSATVTDKSMLKSTLTAMDKKYVNKVLPKDVINSVLSVNKAGILIEDYKVEKHNSVQGDYEIHTIKFTPINGRPSTVHLRVPTVKEDGTFKIGSVEYRTRKQRLDAPIRKIDYNRVGLTSYYGKVFVDRAPMKKYDYHYWLFRQLTKLAGKKDGKITALLPSDVSIRHSKEMPTDYTGLSRYVSTFTFDGIRLTFTYSNRHKLVDDELLAKLEKGDRVLVGKKGKTYYLLNNDNHLIAVKDDQEEDLGTIADWIGIDTRKAPIEYSMLRVFNKYIPIVYVLSYLIGFDNLVKLTKAKYRTEDASKRVTIEPHEYAIKFNDVWLILDKRDVNNTMLFAGLREYEKDLKLVKLKELNDRSVLFSLFDKRGITTYFVKELELQDKMFVDPMTKDLLKEMKEPVTYRGLLLRANELLLTDYHPDPQDMRFMVIKNYERIPGMLYKQLVQSVKDYQYRNLFGTAKFETDPYGLWKTMLEDSAKVMIQDHNPIAYLKETEDVTYTGFGGRSKEGMNKESRAFHKSDIGIFSEATKDTGDVGITAYLSANPKLKNLRGLPGEFDFDVDGATSILSTSGLLAPSATNDDPKRTNFVSIQNTHNIPITGQEAPYVRTGYENVLPYRVGDRFVFVAEEDGKVIKKTKEGIVVEYKSGKRKGVKLGRKLSRVDGGVSYAFNIEAMLDKGDTFKKDAIIAYNTAYFERDLYDPTKLVYKQGTAIRTAIFETSQTYEDSCAISTKITDKLAASTSKLKEYVIKFDNAITDMVKPGDKVKPDSPLLYILDDITVSTGIFDKDALKALKNISSVAPTAKYEGVIERVELYYNGDKEDMSGSIKELTDWYDAILAKESKATGGEVVTGKVDTEFRVQGKPLPKNHLVIKIYITTHETMGIGDKGVFGNQLKTTVGEVYDYPMTTEDGKDVEAVFGYRSIAARIVLSPFIVGTTITLLKVIADKAVKMYRS